jgi:hypothetical protein
MKGGLADKMSIEDIAKKHNIPVETIIEQVEIGYEIEFEHTDDGSIALEIALDHLVEIPDYYTRLVKMEEEAKENLREQENDYE